MGKINTKLIMSRTDQKRLTPLCDTFKDTPFEVPNESSDNNVDESGDTDDSEDISPFRKVEIEIVVSHINCL